MSKDWVFLDTVVLLRLADFWKDLASYAAPQYEATAIMEFSIARASVQPIRASVSLNNDHSFPPPCAEHPWHKDNSNLPKRCLRG